MNLNVNHRTFLTNLNPEIYYLCNLIKKLGKYKQLQVKSLPLEENKLTNLCTPEPKQKRKVKLLQRLFVSPFKTKQYLL